MLLKQLEKGLEAGTDEAGRGSLAGPVFAAAVILPHNFNEPMLKDSKKTTTKQRNILRKIIEKKALAFSISSCGVKEIDQLNILNASIKAMHKSISFLKIKPNSILVDGNYFKKYFEIPHECIIKGDSKFMNIAAASILAKTYRDDFMIRLSSKFPEYEWDINKGYPTKKHREFLKKYGICKYHRKSFKLSIT
ncbi:MAG: ribonuclease HII [Flavobacteriaceae bacterium]|nr:ribonuclease HII [Flavobacteriaceae bacterium]